MTISINFNIFNYNSTSYKYTESLTVINVSTFYLHQVRNARNEIMHTSEFKVTEPDFRTYSQSMINLLNDVNISASPRAQHAVAQIQRVCMASCLLISLI